MQEPAYESLNGNLQFYELPGDRYVVAVTFAGSTTWREFDTAHSSEAQMTRRGGSFRGLDKQVNIQFVLEQLQEPQEQHAH